MALGSQHYCFLSAAGWISGARHRSFVSVARCRSFVSRSSAPNDDDDDEHQESVLEEDPLFGVELEESLFKIHALMERNSRDDDNLKDWLDLLESCKEAVDVGPSSIEKAGLGLFAAQSELNQGSIISFYPVHGMGVEVGVGEFAMASVYDFDQAYFDAEQDCDSHTNYRQHLLGNRNLGTLSSESIPPLLIDVNLQRPLQPGWTSHLVNDGSVVQQDSQEGVLEYYQASLERQNCVPIPFGPLPVVAMVTTRPVRMGEEFFTSYGSAFWLDALGNQSRPTSPKIQKYIKQYADDLLSAAQKAKREYKKELASLQALWDGL